MPLILSLADNNRNKISIYPNPATNYLYIRGIPGSSEAKLYDPNGQLVKTCIIYPSERFPIENLQPGLYFLKIDDFEIIKFIKT